MEDPKIEDSKESTKSEDHLTSAAAFVEGGIQDACDDACSICLEVFCDSDPSTVTMCKHEFHLQCILEWCQRSSQCPMCWQPISLKDPTSQELLEAVERERSFRFNPSRNATIFHHPTLGDFELQHLPMGTNDAELEERIIQHLAAAAAMGRARHVSRREGQRTRISGHGRPHILVFSANQNAPSSVPTASSPAQNGSYEAVPEVPVVSPFLPPTMEDSQRGSPSIPSHEEQGASSPSGSAAIAVHQQGPLLDNRRSPSHSSPNSQDRAGPSEFQSFSESLKSRFNAVSTRCKESIAKSTRGWKERFFTQNTSMADLSSEVRREVNAGIATVSRMMERLETRDSRASSSVSNSSSENVPVMESGNLQSPESPIQNHPNEANAHASCPTNST